MKKILIIKMWAIGDILMATPMLTAIRASEPDAHIAWLVDSNNASLLTGHPLIDELIVVDSGAWRRLRRRGKLIAWAQRTNQIRAPLRRRRFDAVINCQAEEWWSALLSPAPLRIGVFAQPSLAATRVFYHHAIPKPRGLHNTDHFLKATSLLGFPPAGKRLILGESAVDRDYLGGFASRNDLRAGQRVMVLAPFSTAENRSLAPDLAVALVGWLSRQFGARIVLTFKPDDAGRAGEIARRCPRDAVIAESTTLREYISLISRADLVISGDSSPMHLAAAFGVPYVALFGPTPVDERAPLVGPGIPLSKPLECAPCDKKGCVHPARYRCMRLIELADVQEAVTRVVLDIDIDRSRLPAATGRL
ncbi:MAG: glycosyltransferase family 9 protein [Capsulimonadaceae bacterium]